MDPNNPNCDEDLIKEVEKYPMFKDKIARENAWSAIGGVLGGLDANSCQQRWTVLRNRYGNEKRINQNPPSGSARADRQQWILMESMGFLDKHIMKRKTTGNMSQAKVKESRPLELESANIVWTIQDVSQVMSSVTQRSTTSQSWEGEDSVNLIQVSEDDGQLSPQRSRPQDFQGTKQLPQGNLQEEAPQEQEGRFRTEARQRKKTKTGADVDALSHSIGNAMSQLGQFLNSHKTADEEADLSFGRTVGLLLKTIPAGKKKIEVQAQMLKLLSECASAQ